VSHSIFEPTGDGAFIPTEAALSPWSDQALHGGPPTMLMAREIERFPAEQPMFVTRLTVELMRAVGRTPLTVLSRLVRPGRRVQLVEASLWNGEHEVARATALRLRTADVEVPSNLEAPPHGPPESVTEWTGGYRSGEVYHLRGVEGRSELDPGGKLGPGWAWFRLKLPLLPGEEPSGLVRICAAADFPNGISNIVDPRVTSFLNPDLTIYVLRLPVDQWVMVDARTWLQGYGTGLAEGALYDRRGRIGRSLQSLLVEPRV
jgi:acyl-Coa thioesterase superfamily protein/acyl-CoA thioesterase superfamily protein